MNTMKARPGPFDTCVGERGRKRGRHGGREGRREKGIVRERERVVM